MTIICQNCGDQVADLCTDQQSMQGRPVVLVWAICSRCRHVALKYWTVNLTSTAEELSSTG